MDDCSSKREMVFHISIEQPGRSAHSYVIWTEVDFCRHQTGSALYLWLKNLGNVDKKQPGITRALPKGKNETEMTVDILG